jgi:lactoylglutathione lyase
MQLAKPNLDVGFMVNDWDAARAFWADTVGLDYVKFEKLGGGVRQHRFDAHGSVVKVNHSRTPVDPQPTIYRGLRVATDVAEPRLLHDPEGVEIELVPPGHDYVTSIEIRIATADPAQARRFWADGIGGDEFAPDRYRVGDTIVTCIHEPGLAPMTTRGGAGFRYLTVQIHDVDTEWARLVDLGFGAELAPVSLGDTARVSFVRDPDGGYLEVSERAEVTGKPIRQDATPTTRIEM